MLQRVYAQVDTDPVLDTGLANIENLGDLFGLVLNVIVGVGIALVVIFLVLGGIQYVMSKGDPKAADAARLSLTNAIIGFVVIIGALTIKAVVVNVLGAEGAADVPGITDGF